jgi:hypothetical protein
MAALEKRDYDDIERFNLTAEEIRIYIRDRRIKLGTNNWRDLVDGPLYPRPDSPMGGYTGK